MVSASLSLSAQESGFLGRVADFSSGIPIPDVSIQVEGMNVGTSTLADGTFKLLVTPGQEHDVTFTLTGYEEQNLKVRIVPGQLHDVGTIFLRNLSPTFEDIPTISFIDAEDESGVAAQNIISLMGASQDIYLSESAFKFGAMRFAVRGFESEYTHTYINGVKFNDQIRGRFNYSMIGGLNDAVRNRDMAIGTTPSRYGFGDLGGVSHINTRASAYNKGGRISASYTNRNYKLRGMGIYSTGLMENNVAVTASMGYRWADEGYVQGTFYNSFGYFLSVEKIFGAEKQHSLSFTTLGSPSQRGQQAPSYQEVYDILDNNHYNPNWGYLNGEKRNARVATSFDPVAILSHRWQISPNSELSTGVGFRYNQYGTTALNWYNAADPRPDYYRYLPSYQSEEETKELYRNAWRNDPKVNQLDWHRFYSVNSGAERAHYMIEERHSNLMELTLNSAFRTQFENNQTITIGVEARSSRGMHYKTANDLFGAQYWLDVDQFAERDFQGDVERSQNDLLNPNRQIKHGDKFGYDYDINVNSAAVWLQNEFVLPRAELYYAAKLSYTGFYRYGNMMNGRAPDNSYKKGAQHDFIDQAIKAGGVYKITGRHLLSANAIYETRAPLPYNSYLSARTKDNAIPELKSERVAAADLSYNIATPHVTGRVTVYQTNFYDQNELNSFYHDSYRTFVNYVMTGIRKVHRGIEAGISVPVTKRITVKAIGTIAEYRYRNRPLGYITYENASRADTTETVYLKNFYVGGSPQTAGSLILSYAHPKYWFFDVNYNHFDRNYVDLTPIRRTPSAVDFTALNQQDREERVQQIVSQEKYAAGGTLDLSIGKSIRFDGGYFVSINLSVNNILDNTDLRTGGFEQGRFDFDIFNVDKFPSKYYYAQGRNFFLNVGLRF
jgi:hypothetical protein